MSETAADYGSEGHATDQHGAAGVVESAETFAREILPCRLDVTELLTKGQDLEAALQRRDEIERERKNAADGFKQQLEEQAASIRELRKCIRTGTEDRPVSVRVTRDYRRGRVVHIRMDTGEIVSDRAMIAAERQQEMPL